jgi:hypothetical protein
VLDVVQTFAPAIALYESLGWNRLEPLRLDLGTAVLDLFVFLGPSGRRPRPQRPGPTTTP